MDELKKVCHLDLGGDEATMKAVNAEYESRFHDLKQAHNTKASTPTRVTSESAGDFMRIIDQLLSYLLC